MNSDNEPENSNKKDTGDADLSPAVLPDAFIKLLGDDGPSVNDLLDKISENSTTHNAQCTMCQKLAVRQQDLISSGMGSNDAFAGSVRKILELPHVDHREEVQLALIAARKAKIPDEDMSIMLRSAVEIQLADGGTIGQGFECPTVNKLPEEEKVAEVEIAGKVVVDETRGTSEVGQTQKYHREEITRVQNTEGCDRLDPQQKQAVELKDGPIMVVAGPGTGKTAMISCRFVNLVDKHEVNPHEILVMSFSNGVVKEITDRLDRMSDRYEALEDVRTDTSYWIRTFNSAGMKLIGRYKANLGFGKDIDIVNEGDAVDLFNEVIKRGKFDREVFPLVDTDDPDSKTHYNLIGSAKANLIAPEDSEEWLLNLEPPYPKEFASGFAKLYAQYDDRLHDDDLIHFDDQVYLIVKFLERQSETILPQLQRQFKYIMVDAYQDMTKAQWRLVELLSEDNHNLMMVGDMDQYIFGFREAGPSFIHEFFNKYQSNGRPATPNLNQVLLQISYRSSSNIVEAALQVINNNEREEPKDLASARPAGLPILLCSAEDEDREIEGVARIIMYLLDQGFNFGDIAILFRTNSLGSRYERELRNMGIEVEKISSDQQRERRRKGITQVDRVSLFTLHRSKGLEFPVVFLVGLEEHIIPHARSISQDRYSSGNSIQDERRLFYVGMTRPRDLLFLCWSKERNEDPQKQSRFISEIPEHLLFKLDMEWNDEEGPFEQMKQGVRIEGTTEFDVIEDGEDVIEDLKDQRWQKKRNEPNEEPERTPDGSPDRTPDRPPKTTPDKPPNREAKLPRRDDFLKPGDLSKGMRVCHELFGKGTISWITAGEAGQVAIHFDSRDENTIFLTGNAQLLPESECE